MGGEGAETDLKVKSFKVGSYILHSPRSRTTDWSQLHCLKSSCSVNFLHFWSHWQAWSQRYGCNTWASTLAWLLHQPCYF